MNQQESSAQSDEIESEGHESLESAEREQRSTGKKKHKKKSSRASAVRAGRNYWDSLWK